MTSQHTTPLASAVYDLLRQPRAFIPTVEMTGMAEPDDDQRPTLPISTKVADYVASLLRQVVADNPTDIVGAVVATGDGIFMFGYAAKKVNFDRLAALAASITGVTTFATGDLSLGGTCEIIMRADDGAVMVLPLTADLILVAPITACANLGMVRLELHDVGLQIVRALKKA